MAVSIRPLASSDQDAVLALNESVVHKLAPMGSAEYQWFLDHAVHAWAATVDGEVAGFVLVLEPGLAYASDNYQWFSANYDEFSYLDRVAVSDRFRRQGVGSAIYDAVEAHAAAAGRPVLLEVNIEPRNDASLAFHAQRGYRKVGTLDHDGGAKVVSLQALQH